MNHYPVRVSAHRDDALNRGLPLIKWLLLIPHLVVLIGLWTAFAVLTLVAYVAILVTGRYPQAIFAFNVGVMRWSWRVNYYGYQALGTDRYPPFTLADVPDYPARLHIDSPPRPPRWLPLVAWLFAIPHILLVGALTGAATWEFTSDDTTTTVPLGVVSVGVLIVVVGLLFTGRYPRGLYDLLLGVARWNIRLTSYLALLTSVYPPFRLDQGEREPDGDPTGPAAPTLVPMQRADSPTMQRADAPTRQRAERSATGSAAGPVTALIAGIVLLFTAVGAGVGGGALLALDGERDTEGYVSSPALTVDSPTAAITAEDITLHVDDLWAGDLTDIGGVRITATSPSGQPLFVGIAPQSAVDRWLTGTAHDQVATISTGTARYERAPGAVQAVSPPASETFWSATRSGTGTVDLPWTVTDGEFAVVVANSGGSPGVVAQVRAATRIPDLTGIGAALLGAGALLGLLAIGLIVLGGTGLGRRHAGLPPITGSTVAGGPQPGPQSGPQPEAQHVTTDRQA